MAEVVAEQGTVQENGLEQEVDVGKREQEAKQLEEEVEEGWSQACRRVTPSFLYLFL